MERLRAVLLTLMCIGSSRISGTEVEMRVRPGDSVTLYCDCVWKAGYYIVWLRNDSYKLHTPLVISVTGQEYYDVNINLMERNLPRYSLEWNSYSRSHDLQVKNVSESDLGLYYCALHEKKITEGKAGGGVQQDVYSYGNRTTRLSLLGTPPVSDCSVCWKLLVSVCPVCVLLSSTCVYWMCRYTTKGRKKLRAAEAENTENLKSSELNKVGEDGVCYASLDLQPRRDKRLKKKRVESSEFSTYSEVRAGQM